MEKTKSVQKGEVRSCSPSSAAPRASKQNTPLQDVTLFQQTLGNQAVQHLYKSGWVKAALKIGQRGDAYEQEADKVADQVMRTQESTISHRPLTAGQAVPMIRTKSG